jgi:molecular chaperone GrpE
VIGSQNSKHPAPEASVCSDAFDAVVADTATAAVDQASESASPVDLAALQRRAAERDEYLDMVQRLRAEFANYQKRTQKQAEQERQFALQSAFRDLLPVIDNLERAQSSASGGATSALLEGVKMVHQNLLATLARYGVTLIASDGTPFDPTCHEAIAKRPSAEVPAGHVLQTLERGYRLHDRVLRPAKVVVAADDHVAAPA